MYLYVEHVYIIMESIMYLHAETKYYIYIVDIHFEISIICSTCNVTYNQRALHAETKWHTYMYNNGE